MNVEVCVWISHSCKRIYILLSLTVITVDIEDSTLDEDKDETNKLLKGVPAATRRVAATPQKSTFDDENHKNYFEAKDMAALKSRFVDIGDAVTKQTNKRIPCTSLRFARRSEEAAKRSEATA